MQLSAIILRDFGTIACISSMIEKQIYKGRLNGKIYFATIPITIFYQNTNFSKRSFHIFEVYLKVQLQPEVLRCFRELYS